MPTPTQPKNAMESELGFRIEIRPGDEAGSVVFFANARRDTVTRPATGVEIKLWRMVERQAAATQPGGVPAESVIDPFGTPKGESDGGH